MTNTAVLGADAILRHLQSLGWATNFYRVDHYAELHAVWRRDPDSYHVARCNDGDGDGDEEVYCAARLLAEACGVGLER